MRPHRQTLAILGLALVMLVAWSVLLPFLPAPAEFAETNYHANLIRLQAYLLDGPRHSALVGSSLSGRLLPRYFESTPLSGIANLGLDGSSPLFGLRLVASQSPLPTLVCLEANLLAKPEGPNDRNLQENLHGVSARLVATLPTLRAQYRPSSMVYSRLKAHRDQQTVGSRALPAPPPAPRPSAGPATVGLQTQTAAHRQQLESVLRQLKAAGVQVVLVRLPTAESVAANYQRLPDLADELSERLGLQQLDVGPLLQHVGYDLRFTDGVHLVADSAREVARLLAEQLRAGPSPRARDPGAAIQSTPR